MRHRLKRLLDRWKTKRYISRNIDDERKISVAITTFNSAPYFEKALHSVLGDPRVEHIVVSDDHSSLDSYEQIANCVRQRLGSHPNIDLLRNSHNVGAFKNKILALKHCQSAWAILLDTDNELSKAYIDKLYSLSHWSTGQIYCPDFAKPRFNFSEFVDIPLDQNLVKTILSDESCIIADGATGPWPRWRSLQTLLSTGNYFVPVREFCHSIEPFRDVEKLTACTIAAVYIWLCSGYSLKIVPGLEYVHRIHDKSLSSKQANANKAMANAFCKMLVEDRGLDVFHNNRLMI